MWFNLHVCEHWNQIIVFQANDEFYQCNYVPIWILWTHSQTISLYRYSNKNVGCVLNAFWKLKLIYTITY